MVLSICHVSVLLLEAVVPPTTSVSTSGSLFQSAACLVLCRELVWTGNHGQAHCTAMLHIPATGTWWGSSSQKVGS